MSLELALVIKGDQAGAKKALDDTAGGIENLGNKAKAAAGSTKEVSDAIAVVKSDAPGAATGVGDLGEAAVTAGGKFSNFKALAIGAIGGIAGSLATAGLDIAFGLALGAATAYFDDLTNSPENVKDDLEAHKGLIASIKGLWNQAEGAASSYGLTSEAGLRVEARSNIGRLDSDFADELQRAKYGAMFDEGGFIGSASDAARDPFKGVIAKFRQDLEDGRADVIAFREDVAKIADALPAGSEGFSLAERILGDTQKSAELQAELQRAVDLYKALTGDADAAAVALGKSAEGMTTNGTQAAGALPALREYAALIASIGGVTVPLPGGGTATGNPGEVGGGFAAGGFTGHSAVNQVAGFVHGQEYVFDAASTAAIGVGNLDAIRKGVRGYAAGGAVGGSIAAGGVGGTGVIEELFSIKDALKQFGTALWNTRNPIQAFVSVLGSVSQNYLNKALGAAGDVLSDLIPGFADGTNSAPGGLAWVGEGGPELVRLPHGTQVFPAGQSARMAGGGDTHNWFITTPSPRAFAESRSSVARTAGRLLGASRRHS